LYWRIAKRGSEYHANLLAEYYDVAAAEVVVALLGDENEKFRKPGRSLMA
jgi:hypothetical protein